MGLPTVASKGLPVLPAELPESAGDPAGEPATSGGHQGRLEGPPGGSRGSRRDPGAVQSGSKRAQKVKLDAIPIELD